MEIFARIIGEGRLEVNRFYHGGLLDSMLLEKGSREVRLFRETIQTLREDGGGDFPIRLIGSDAEFGELGGYGEEWKEDGLSFEALCVGETLISHWAGDILESEDGLRTFDRPIRLKPWRMPQVAYPFIAALFVYGLFVWYQVHSFGQISETSRTLKKQIAQFETQWKPIERLQTRIAKFQEDKKTLTEFSAEGYPLLEFIQVLTAVTPDDTWMNYLSLKKGQAMVRGESKSAIKYLSDLSKVDGFGDVKFASPVNKNPSSDQERFNLQLELDREKLRKTIETLFPGPGVEKGSGEAPPSVSGPPPAPPAADQSVVQEAPETPESNEPPGEGESVQEE